MEAIENSLSKLLTVVDYKTPHIRHQIRSKLSPQERKVLVHAARVNTGNQFSFSALFHQCRISQRNQLAVIVG